MLAYHVVYHQKDNKKIEDTLMFQRKRRNTGKISLFKVHTIYISFRLHKYTNFVKKNKRQTIKSVVVTWKTKKKLTIFLSKIEIDLMLNIKETSDCSSQFLAVKAGYVRHGFRYLLYI
jgi:hypothetical protein